MFVRTAALSLFLLIFLCNNHKMCLISGCHCLIRQWISRITNNSISHGHCAEECWSSSVQAIRNLFQDDCGHLVSWWSHLASVGWRLLSVTDSCIPFFLIDHWYSGVEEAIGHYTLPPGGKSCKFTWKTSLTLNWIFDQNLVQSISFGLTTLKNRLSGTLGIWSEEENSGKYRLCE